MTQRQEKSRQSNRIVGLTIIRWPLALWVLIHHSLELNLADASTKLGEVPDLNTFDFKGDFVNALISVIHSTGNLAPQFFFIISGFVIAFSYERIPEPRNKVFYWKRFISLYPMYLVSTCIAFLIFPSDRKFILWHLLGIQSFLPNGYWFTLNGPGWSLSVEFILYLLFPLVYRVLVRILRDFSLKIFSCLWLMLYLSSYFLIGISVENELAFYLLYHFPLFQLFYFVFGILLYFDWKKQLNSSKNNILITCACFGIFCAGVTISYFTVIPWLKLGIFSLPGSLLITWLLARKRIYDKGKIVKVLNYLGFGTFVFYITHWIWIGLVRKVASFSDNLLTSFFIVITLATLIGVPSSLVQSYLAKCFQSYRENRKKRVLNLGVIFYFLSLTYLAFLFPNTWRVDYLPVNDKLSSKLVSVNSLNALTMNQPNLLELEFRITNNSIHSISTSRCFIIDNTNLSSIRVEQANPYLSDLTLNFSPGESKVAKFTSGRAGMDELGPNAFNIGCR